MLPNHNAGNLIRRDPRCSNLPHEMESPMIAKSLLPSEETAVAGTLTVLATRRQTTLLLKIDARDTDHTTLGHTRQLRCENSERTQRIFSVTLLPLTSRLYESQEPEFQTFPQGRDFLHQDNRPASPARVEESLLQREFL